MKIDGSKLIIYDGDKPIEVSTGLCSVPENYISVLEPGSDHTLTFESFTDPFEDPEYCKVWIWHKIRSMPRKKKKRIKRLLEKGYTMNVTFV